MRSLWFALPLALAATTRGLSSPFVTSEDWKTNAHAITELYDSNRSDKEFLTQFTAYIASLFISATADGVEKNEKQTFYIVMYFDLKLERQYLTDHRAKLGDDYFFSMLKNLQQLESSFANELGSNEARIRIIRFELVNFQKSFGNNSDLILRAP